MPDDEYGRLNTGSFAYVNGVRRRRAKRVNTGFQNPGEEFPPPVSRKRAPRGGRASASPKKKEKK